MACEWREVAVSDIADLSGGFAFKSEDYALSGRFILRTLNIRDDCSISRDDAVYLPEELCPQYARFELKPNDTLFVMVGATLGKVGFVRETDLPALLNQNIWLVRAKQDVADPRFVHYAFRHAVKASLGWASGSARDFVRRDDYRDLQLSVPPLREQRAIAHILGTLDDKIELNRRMNETLEAIARVLFRSWFVDFDPVRAKAEGRDHGLPKPLADLFPDSLEDSARGEIPKGWQIGTVGDLCTRILEKVDDPEDWRGQRLIDLSRMPQNSIALTEWGLGEELTTSVTRFSRKDTLFGAIRPYFHKVGVAPIDGVTNVSVFVLRARRESDWPFVGILCSMADTIEYATRVSRGTKMPVITWPDLRDYQCVVPSPAVRDAFALQTGSLLERMMGCIHESRSLATIRAALLPRLVSGELRIKDAERIIGRVQP